MKKVFFALSLLLASMVANAQNEVASTPQDSNTTIPATLTPKETYTNFRFSYSPTVWDLDGTDLDMRGLKIEYIKGEKFMDDMPVFLEYGLGLEWLNYEDKETVEDNNKAMYTIIETINTIALNIPLNIGYKYNLQSGSKNISIIPYAGINATFNISGTQKTSFEDIDDEFYEFVKDYGAEDIFDEEKANMFDDDEFGESTLKRLLLGWRIGANVNINNIQLGVSYHASFGEEIFKDYEDTHQTATTFTVGYLF